MRPDSTGVHDLKTHFRDTVPDVVTLPQYLRSSGYHTIGMGKVYHDEQPEEWDEWIETKKIKRVSEYHLKGIAADIRNRESEAKAKGLKRQALRKYTKGPSTESADRPDTAYEDGAMTRLAIEKIQSAGDSPFFMTVGYHKPHLPFVAPQKYWDLYDAEKIHLADNDFAPEGAPGIALMSWGELRSYSDIPRKGPVTQEKARELTHGYFACISFVDAQIGMLLDALKEAGLDDNTIVVLWSDHGWKLGNHAMWCKHTNFEIDARVPLIIRMPGHASGGQVNKAFVELVDLYPTLCEAAGLAVPESCEGASLVPLLEGQPTPDWRQHAVSQYKRSRNKGGDIIGYSIKVCEGRYTEWINQETGKRTAVEYYDHLQDPNENRNAYGDLSKEKSRALSALLKEER